MKKWCIIFILLVCSACSIHKESAPEAFAAYLEENWSKPETVFTLLYLDGDETPEMAVTDGEEPESTVHLIRYDENTGTAEEVGAYSMYGQMFYIDRTGFFLPMYFVAPGGGTVLQYQNGEVSEYEMWEISLDGEYIVNGELVSEEDFSTVADRWLREEWTPVFDENAVWRIDEVNDVLRNAIQAGE